jgi:hypothetical protein
VAFRYQFPNFRKIKKYFVEEFTSLLWEDNNQMNLQEVECGSMDWIELADDRDRCRTLVNAVMNRRVP